jgi:hypothetical protein
MPIQKDRKDFTRYYNAVSAATKKLSQYNLNINTLSEQNFVNLYGNLIINEFVRQNVPKISNYPSPSFAEIQLFVHLMSLYTSNQSFNNRISMIDNYMQAVENNSSITQPIKERLYALSEMLKAAGTVDLSKFHKYEGESTYERRLNAAISDQLAIIFDNPVSAGFFIIGLPKSFVQVVAVATYKVMRGDYNHIE